MTAVLRTARPRVALVGPGFHLLGGLSVYTCRLANALSRDFEVSVLLLHKVIPARLYPGGRRAGRDLSSLRYEDGVDILGTVNWYWGWGLLRAVRALRAARPEVLLLQWWTAAALHTYLALALVAKILRIPVVIEFHETQDTGEAALPLVAGYCRRLMPVLLRLAAGGLVHSEHDRDLLERTYGAAVLDRLAIETAPHGPYDHLPVLAASDRLPSPGAPSVPVTRLLFFGLIRPYKGLEDLVLAFSALSDEQAAGFELTVVGETWEGWTLPAALIEASPHRNRIRFVNRYVSDAEASGFFTTADAVVLPYRRGSASGPLHIAMSSGLHVVLYAVGGLVEAVRAYEGAVLVEPDDIDGLRTALLALPPRAQQRFADPHSWRATSEALDRLRTRVG